MNLNFGIGSKLFLAVGSMIILYILTSLVMWYRFQDIANTQQSVIQNAIPAMNEAQQLAELSALIIASVPDLVKVSDEGERVLALQNVNTHIDKVNELLAEFDRHNFSLEQVALLNNTINQIIENVKRQNELVKVRLHYENKNRTLFKNSINSVHQLSNIAESLVANSGASTTAVISTIYDLVDSLNNIDSPQKKETVYEALDRLIEVDLDGMERMFELHLRCSILMDQLQQISNELNPQILKITEQNMRGTLAIIGRRINDIKDPGRLGQANSSMTQLITITKLKGVDAFYPIRMTIINSLKMSDVLTKENHDLLVILNNLTVDLVSFSNLKIEQATQKAESSVNLARRALISIGVISPLLILAIFAIYVRVLVRRISSLEYTTRKIAEGNYTTEIDTNGRDELSRMANALQIFKDNAIEKDRLDNDLKKYKRDLEKTVEERTMQLHEMNIDLKDEAEKHQTARELAEQASRAKTTFLATMSHEIRTPMNGIMGTLNLLGKTSLSEKQRYFTGIISSASRSLLDILNDVLDFSSIETGKLEIENENFDLENLIQGVITLMQPAARDKDLELITDIDARIKPMFKGDAGKLRQILINLINNAIKFTDQGRIDLVATIITEELSDVTIRFDILDTGIGIKEEMMSTIFEPFAQVEKSLSKNAGGIGLGLAICQRLVLAMSGTINASRRPTGGTCLSVELKIQKASKESLSVTGTHEIEKISAMQLFKVLLVEDDEINRMITQSFLEEFGHQVVTVTEAESALKQLKEHDFDIVLTDISLPGMDGMELTKTIRSFKDTIKSQVPIVAISAHVLKQEVYNYLHSGISGFLGKPYEPEKLNEVLQKSFRHTTVDPEALELSMISNIDCHEILSRDAEYIGVDVIEEMVELFLKSSIETIDNINNGIHEKQWQKIEHHSHKLKSASSSLGLNELWHLSEELEMAAINEDTDIFKLKSKLTTTYNDACKTLKEVWHDIKDSALEH